MYFDVKDYQILKIKKKLKKEKILLIFNSTRLNNEKWLKVEQKLRKLKLNYYKVLNVSGLNVFKTSTFKNYSNTLCGVVILINPSYISTFLDIKRINKELKPLFILLAIKINNNIYSASQLKLLKLLNYKQETLNLVKSLDFSIKKHFLKMSQ